jgi:PatG Domain
MDDPGVTQPSTPTVSPSPSLTRPGGSCQTCGNSGPAASASPTQPVLAVGKIRITYPNESVEKHFAQVIGRQDSKGRSDLQLIRDVLAKAENRYLARQACWTLDIMDSPAYILRPRDFADMSLLVDALGASTSSIDVVIGEITGLASPRDCGPMQLPLVIFETLYIFEREQLVKSMSRPEKIPPDEFQAIAQEVFDRMMLPNKGTGLYRGINFVNIFYDKVHGLAVSKISEGFSLISVDVRPSPVSGPHQLAKVCLKFRHRQTDLTELYCCTVNLDNIFPFLVEKLYPSYEMSVP